MTHHKRNIYTIMIFVRDKGRMCNNILQYGHAYAWAREHKRSVMSMRFSYKYQYFKLCHELKHNFLFYIIGKYAAKLRILPTIGFMLPEDMSNEDLKQKMFSCRHFVLEGLFVLYPELFMKYIDEIRDMFSFDAPIAAKIKQYISATSKADDIRLGIHIRRGDYKNFRGGMYYYEDDVYISFIRAFAECHKDRHVSIYICSNDPKLDRETYVKELPDCTVNIPAGNPAEDLCLLSECDYLIGAPSSFSMVATMYHDIPLLWMRTSDCKDVMETDAWKKFKDLVGNVVW